MRGESRVLLVAAEPTGRVPLNGLDESFLGCCVINRSLCAAD